MSGIEGDKYSPTEVREEVQGALLSVASVVKGVVREKGEGIWTDADQKLVNDIVGSVSSAKTYEDAKRRVEMGVERMNAVFGPKMGGTQIPMPDWEAAEAAAVESSREFATEAEALASGVKGQVIIGGRKAVID